MSPEHCRRLQPGHSEGDRAHRTAQQWQQIGDEEMRERQYVEHSLAKPYKQG